MRLTPAQEQTYLKYAELALPRHTSYPTVPHWGESWTASDYHESLQHLAVSAQPLGLYIHVPFCRQLCFYCACTREIVTDQQRASADERLTGAGYLGLDHFVKPHDPLAQAAAAGTLTRTFQGMAAGRERATVALGPSGISQGASFYSQNPKTTKAWRQAVTTGLPVARGMTLSVDDRLRRDILRDLYASGRIDLQTFRTRTGQDFRTYFERELPALEILGAEGLVALTDETLTLSPTLGRLLVRVVASVFDRYLPPGSWRTGMAAGQASQAG